MLFGGSNPGDWAARELTSSYDYNAPIREWGGVGDRYQRVWALGHFLREHGAKLARSEVVECEIAGTQKDVSVVERHAQDGGRYFFVRTSQHDESRAGTARVKEKTGGANEIVFNYNLEPFGSVIFYLPPGVNDVSQGEWLPKAAPTIERPTDLPATVTITSAQRQTDSGPTSWTKMKSGQNLAQLGVYNSGFIFYQTKISSTTPTNLMVEFPENDVVLATINGKTVARVGGTSSSSVFDLPAGSSTVQLLYENRGHDNGGGIDRPAGILSVQLVRAAQVAGQPVGGWRMREVNSTSKKRPELKADFNDAELEVRGR